MAIFRADAAGRGMTLGEYLASFGIVGPLTARWIRRHELTGHDFERAVDCGD